MILNNFINNLKENNKFFYFIIFLFCTYSVIISNLQGIYTYDGYHWGLVASSANDYLNDKIPFKEIFIHYGILTTIIHSVLYSFTNSVYQIFFFTSIIYALSILFTSLLIKKFTNNNYSYFFLFVAFFFQPFTVFPWHTYLIYFFLSLGLYLYFNKTYISYFFYGIFIQSVYLISDSFKICSYLIFVSTIYLIYLDNKKKNYSRYIFTFISGFFLPLIIFLAYLYFKGNLEFWIKHDISGIFIELTGGSLFILLNNFIINFLKNFYYKPHYILFLIINLSCITYIFLFLIKKFNNNDIFYISLISIFLNYLLVFKFETFRVFNGIIIGLIVTFYLIYKIKKFQIKQFLILTLILLTPFSNPFEKGQANRIFLAESEKEQSFNNPSFKQFKYMKFNNDVWLHFGELKKIVTSVKENCTKIEKFYNLTSDHYYYLIMSDYFESGQLIPGYDERVLKDYYDGLTKLDENFYQNIKLDVLKEKAIFIREDINLDKLSIKNKKIDINQYNFKNLPYSYYNKLRRVYLPKNCADKIL